MAAQCPNCRASIPAGSRFCQACGSTVEVEGKKAKGATAKRRTGGGFLWLGLGGLLAVAIVALLALRPGGAGGGDQSKALAQMSHDQMMGHLKTEAGPVPAWLAKADRDVVTEYTWAVDHHEELKYIPCYCGCNREAGHMSNYNCYFSRGANGKVAAYDPHSYG